MNAVAVDLLSLSPRVKSFVGRPHQALIAGRWQEAEGGATFDYLETKAVCVSV